MAAPWRTALIDYLRGNRDRVARAVADMPGLSMAPVEATYLAWIDTGGSGIDRPCRFFEQAGVGLSDGSGLRHRQRLSPFRAPELRLSAHDSIRRSNAWPALAAIMT